GEIALHAAVCARCRSALVVSILQLMIKIQAPGECRDVAGEGVIVTKTRFRAFVPNFAQLNRIGVGSRSKGQNAHATSALPFTVTGEVSAEGFNIQLSVLGKYLLVFEQRVIALEAEAVEEARALVATVLIQDVVRQRHVWINER